MTTTLIVRQNRIGPIRGRHPWVFSGALQNIPDGIESGTPVILTDEAGNFLAQGYFSSYSQIAVRIWSWDEEEINDAFFENRIRRACELRKNYVENKGMDSYRLIHSENDLLPGLIVDKYADYLVLQFHTAGIDFWKEKVVNALVKIVKPRGIYERSDVRDRRREPNWSVIPAKAGIQVAVGPEPRFRGDDGEAKGLLYGKVPEKVKIKENGFLFYVDIIGGQKTGFFLDQRDKRQALLKYAKGKSVLNCFAYTGGFSVYALGGGARRVVSVDVSESALELAKENMKLNKLDLKKCEFIKEDVKQYLQQCRPEPGLSQDKLRRWSPSLSFLRKQESRSVPTATGFPLSLASGEQAGMTSKGFPACRQAGSASQSPRNGAAFDVVILDPPAFIKDRHKIAEGIVGYRKINEAALRILQPGGILVSCSCSAHLSLQDFRYMISESAGRAGRTLQILETYTHGIDHPELAAFTEGEYLKCVFALVG